jgi:hypothetical protein
MAAPDLLSGIVTANPVCVEEASDFWTKRIFKELECFARRQNH